MLKIMKTNIYNKVKKATRGMSNLLLIPLLPLLLGSCVDTVILPDDKTVDEDFWKSKSDVQLMVNGAYKSMLSTDIVKRLIVWGDLRSDELLPVVSVQGSAAQTSSRSIQPIHNMIMSLLHGMLSIPSSTTVTWCWHVQLPL